jgi:hypothetical protein
LKKINKKSISLLLTLLFINIFTIHSQSSDKMLVLNWFDKNAGKETLPINNGKLHINYDRIIGTENRYYNLDKLTQGSLNYDSQEYFDVDLIYDIYKDEVILNSQGESGLIKVNLIKENVKYFKLNEKKFVNLNIDKQLPPNFRGGYYEENLIAKSFTFYIKHYKNSAEVIKNDALFIDYTYKNEFILFKNGTYTLINSKSQLLKLFPNKKNKINDYYLMNRKLKKENETRFMENLMNYIKNI